MRKITKTALSAALFAASAFSAACGSQAESMDPIDENQEIVQNLLQAGYPKRDIQVVDGSVFVGGDAHVTLAASREMIDLPQASTKEQYRTNNLVGAAVSKICVNPTASFNSYSVLSAGLDLAIENYNQQGLRFRFARGPAADCNATITIATNSSTGGVAGFPAGGLPYGQVFIGTGLQAYSTDVSEHVISHELGHTIGFRHSDFYNRAISCGSGTNEGDAGYGAVLIPGTPSTAVVGGSVMNACFRPSETGEFTASDVTALKALYACTSNTLTAGQELLAATQQKLSSCNGAYALVMQSDSNLVLYKAGGTPIWASGTWNMAIRAAVMQSDGNFVEYNTAGAARWASNTNGNPGATLKLQDDGDLVLLSASGALLWHTNTAGR